MVDAESFGKQAILRFHHVEITVARKFCMQSVAGLARFAVADAVWKNDEKLCRIERLIFPKKLIRKFRARDELRAASGCPVHDENCVHRFALRIFLWFPDGPIMQMQLWQRLARRKFKIVDCEI